MKETLEEVLFGCKTSGKDRCDERAYFRIS